MNDSKHKLSHIKKKLSLVIRMTENDEQIDAKDLNGKSKTDNYGPSPISSIVNIKDKSHDERRKSKTSNKLPKSESEDKTSSIIKVDTGSV